MEPEYFVSCSFGADSTATAILAVENNEPLTALVYCEVMFSKDISAEVPEHRDFIYNVAIPYFEKRGIPTIVLRSRKTALEWMESPVTKGPRAGKLHGFPLSGKRGWCSVKRDCKLPPLNEFQQKHAGAIYYEGICIDEETRIKEEKKQQGRYLLVKYGYTQKMARDLCEERGLLSPIYEFTKRGGCFFCPNARDEELWHLRKFHPDLWARMMEIQMNPNTVRPGKFRVVEGLQDIERNFELEEMQLTLF